jgi:hypothetical protein
MILSFSSAFFLSSLLSFIFLLLSLPFSFSLRFISLVTIDLRTWSTHFEEEFYHPSLLERLKQLRREIRNDDEANTFIAKTDYRKKNFSFQIWDDYRRKRIFMRHVIISYELRCTVLLFGEYLDHWKKISLEHAHCLTIQRYVRGFLGRCRKRFIQRIKKKVLRIQKHSRQLMVKLKVNSYKSRLYWATTTIQRLFRGRKQRKMVGTMIEAYYDTRKRQLAKEKEQWHFSRLVRASIAIQMVVRRFLRRRRTMKHFQQIELQREIEDQMNAAFEESKVQEEVYKQELTHWYIRRKEEHDELVMNEKQTTKERKKILDRKTKRLQEEKRVKALLRAEKLVKLEEERVEKWVKDWEIRIQEIGIQKRNQCKNCLILPETPEEIALKKDLQKRIKVHIKEVLRKADKQKIPMEIPEAFEIATKEIIEEDVNSAMENARKRMKSEALRIQEDERKKKEDTARKEIEGKARRQVWAILTLQKYMRIFLSRKRLRLQAYKRYERFFNIQSHEYYYQDKKTKETFWEKPQSLGSYDVPMEDYWILIPGKTADGILSDSLSYYYNPSTWEMSWIRPLGTTLCDVCQKEFAKIHYNEAGYDQHMVPGIHYCLPCFLNGKIQDLLYSYRIPPKDIFFQQFNGGQTTSLYLDFTLLPVIDYYSYSMEINPLYKASEEEEMLSKYQEELEEKSGKSHFSSSGLCENCFKRSSEIQCIDCKLFYCELCNKKEHKLGNRKNHQRIAIQKVDNGGGEESDGSKSNRLRFPALQKTSSLLLNSAENYYDSDEGEQQEEEQNYESDFTNTDYTSATEDGKGRPTGEKKKRKKKKLKKEKKSRTKKVDGALSVTSDMSDSEVEKPIKKKKLKKKKDKENSLSDTDDATTIKSPEKKKIKTRKAVKDGNSDSAIDSDVSPPKKAKKPKRKKLKTKSTSDSESEDSPKRLILPPINQRPASTSAVPDDSSVDSPKRYSTSAGDPLNLEKKKKKIKKSGASVTDDSPSEVEAAGNEPRKKKKKKTKESADDTSAGETPSKPKKKTKKPKDTHVVDESTEKEKKKKKSKKSKSDASDNDASSLSESYTGTTPLKTPKKKKRKEKKKDTDEEIV